MNADSSAVFPLSLSRAALVAIDLQNGIAAGHTVPHSPETVVGNARRLCDAFTAGGGFIVLVNVAYTDRGDLLKPPSDVPSYAALHDRTWSEIVPLLNAVPRTFRITKRQWGAFYGTELDLQLRRRGIDTLVLCGISTGIGVDTTARDAFQMGYRQVFAEDAMAAFTEEEHAFECGTIFPKIGHVRTTSEILSLIKA